MVKTTIYVHKHHDHESTNLELKTNKIRNKSVSMVFTNYHTKFCRSVDLEFPFQISMCPKSSEMHRQREARKYHGSVG